jgi:hypothetical protein
MESETLTDDEWQHVQDDLRSAINVFRDAYDDDANSNELVEETDEWVLFRDGSGHELNEIAKQTGVDRSALSLRMHEEARERYQSDHPGDEWSVTDPIVIIKE